MATLKEIDAAVRAVGKQFDGYSGNCARFAAVLNRVLGGEGEYVLVDGGHYQFVDHVLLKFRGRMFDASGIVTQAELRSGWCEDGEEIEPFLDDSDDGAAVRKLVDDNGVFAARWDDEDLEAALRDALPGFPASPGIKP